VTGPFQPETKRFFLKRVRNVSLFPKCTFRATLDGWGWYTYRNGTSCCWLSAQLLIRMRVVTAFAAAS
jgi:hypothetical protein